MVDPNTVTGIEDMEVDADGHLICTMSNGTVLDAGLVKGPQGEKGPPGSVSSVAGKQPQEDGNVELTAEDVGARPDTWMPDGLIYRTTAQALEAMSQEQQASLYTQGYRAVVATYNDTVTMHALAEDGSLAWIGCNQDTTNLLDNPDFAIAQAGYGGTHGTQVYAADRWKGSGTGATFAAGSGGGLVITCGTDAAGCSQVVANPPAVGDYFSFIVVVGGVPLIVSGTWTGTAQDATATSGALTASVNAGSVQINVSSGSATVDYCMLLIGSYTQKTLPPYVPKGYAAELAECLRYYQAISSDSWTTCARPLGSSGFLVNLSAASPMRTSPQIAGKFKIFLESGWTEEIATLSTALTVSGYIANIATQVDAENGKAYIVTGTYELIADL